MRKKIGRFLGLMIVTGFALAVAIMITTGGWGRTAPGESDRTKGIVPGTPVSVKKVELESIEITDTYSGMIRPLERFSLGFEIPGRVAALGNNAANEPLDEGDPVAEGQVLAQLDDRVLRSQLDEAKAQVEQAKAQLEQARAQIKQANAQREQAQSDLARSTELKESGNRMISESEYQDRVTKVAVADAEATSAQALLAAAQAQLAMAEAQLPTAQKNFEDATLRCPVAGVISKRLVNAGESVGAHLPIMEVIQVDEVLLVVGVPEAYVGEIQVGQAAHVELLARDRFQRARPRSQGRVYQVAEAADQTTGLFEVEIVLPNTDRRWRPGQIGLAHIVLKEIQGFRIPVECVVFRDDETYLFAVDGDGKARRWPPQQADGPEAGNPRDSSGRTTEPEPWIEQGQHLVLSELPPEYRTIVTRGQRRLVDGRPVQVLELADNQPAERSRKTPVQVPSSVANAKPRSPAAVAGSEQKVEARD